MRLGLFLSETASSRGPWNCSTLAADWCIALGHPDFAAKWRAVTGEADDVGPLLDLWNEGIGAALPRVDGGLEPGDIAILSLGPLETGAIWTGERWAIRRPKGLHFAAVDQLDLVAAWRP